jgi:hypothetical protein
VYQFPYARGSAGTFTQRYLPFEDGRQEYREPILVFGMDNQDRLATVNSTA